MYSNVSTCWRRKKVEENYKDINDGSKKTEHMKKEEGERVKEGSKDGSETKAEPLFAFYELSQIVSENFI
jgi:hypothetical protein